MTRKSAFGLPNIAGIFFVTLRQKAVAKMLPQLFSLLYRTKLAKAMTDFQSAFYRDLQLLPGGWIFCCLLFLLFSEC